MCVREVGPAGNPCEMRVYRGICGPLAITTNTSMGTSHHLHTPVTGHYGLLPNLLTGLYTRLSVFCRFGACTSTFSKSNPSSSFPMRLRLPAVLPAVPAVLISATAIDLDRVTRLLLGSVGATLGSTIVDTATSTVVSTTEGCTVGLASPWPFLRAKSPLLCGPQPFSPLPFPASLPRVTRHDECSVRARDRPAVRQPLCGVPLRCRRHT